MYSLHGLHDKVNRDCYGMQESADCATAKCIYGSDFIRGVLEQQYTTCMYSKCSLSSLLCILHSSCFEQSGLPNRLQGHLAVTDGA